ncbi:MAG: beta-eliminating lyase-related protein [Chloroflexota bacterium]
MAAVKKAKSSKPLSQAERLKLRAMCDRAVAGHGLRTPAVVLAEIATLSADDLKLDIYGEGGTVMTLEDEVRGLLGKPAAVFMPSGTMIQQIALRIHADARASRVVAFHPTCHLELHEDKAYQRLHGLIGRTVGNKHELITLADLKGIKEPIAALLIELPQREIGGRLPAWKDLVAQTSWARDHGVATHMDGARLWECRPFYDRPLSEIAALFDTVYVSFYKGLGGPAGGMLLGDEEVIAEAREWRHRHGGTLFNMWPYAAAALAGLRLRLPRMPKALKHARSIAGALAKIDGVEVFPDPPQTPMMHINLRTTPEIFDAGVRRLATEQKLWAFGGSSATETPGIRGVELYVGDATLELTPAEVVQAVRALLPG